MARQTIKAIVQMFKASIFMFNLIFEMSLCSWIWDLFYIPYGRSKPDVIYSTVTFERNDK